MFQDLALDLGMAQFHKGGLKVKKLFVVEKKIVDALEKEVRQLVDENKPSSVNTKGHVTNWTKPFGNAFQFSLWNRSGKLHDFSSDHDGRPAGKHFHHSHQYPMLGNFINRFPAPNNFRLNGLDPDSGLSPHEENIAFRRGNTVFMRARFHLPVVTNPKAEVLLDDEWFHLERGFIYFFNNGCVHSAANQGTETRLHLVWDMWLNQKNVELMFGTKDVSKTIQRIPDELSKLEPTRLDEIKKFERQRRKPGKEISYQAFLNMEKVYA